MIRLVVRVTDEKGIERTVAIHVDGDLVMIPLDTDGPTELKGVRPGTMMSAELVYDDGWAWGQFKWSNRGDGTFVTGYSRLPS